MNTQAHEHTHACTHTHYLHSHVAKHAHLPTYIYSGPKLEEVAIFWQMVMEQKPAVVVMLTKVEENGKVSSLCTLLHQTLLCI